MYEAVVVEAGSGSVRQPAPIAGLRRLPQLEKALRNSFSFSHSKVSHYKTISQIYRAISNRAI